MRKIWNTFLVGAVAVCLASTALAVDLVGYYQFEGDFSNSSTSVGGIGAAIPTQNPTQVNLIGGGFRGGGVDINDPAMNGGSNSGGSLNIPFNANPNESPTVTFGGWFNLQSNNGFPGAMAIDNGGWDRGIHLFGNNWGIASGGNTNNIGPAAVGDWQFVVGTFDKPNNIATLYVGNDVAATQTTLSGSRADGGNNPGETQIEIGRYDNQDLDALVDDAFVFQEALTAEQVNAIRNLRLNPALDYNIAEVDQLLDLFDRTDPGPVVSIDGTDWVIGNVQAGNPGELFDLGGGNFGLLLDQSLSANNGLVGSPSQVVPEPSTIAMWLLLGAVGAAFGYRRMRRA